MVLSMPDFGESWKSLQTLWNASKTVLKWFLTASATVCVDLGWIRKGRKLANFGQKAWAIAPGFEHGRFWQVLEIAPNSVKRLQKNDLWPCLCRFRVNDFLSKRPDCLRDSKGRKSTDFEQKAWVIAHGFEHARFWQVLLAPNSLKRLQNQIAPPF